MKKLYRGIPVARKDRNSCTAALMWSLFALSFPRNLVAAEVVTLEQAIRMAIKQNPSLAASQSEVAAARARATRAGRVLLSAAQRFGRI